MLNAELQSLDGANIQTMLGSEVAVNSLIAIIDAAMDTLREVEEEVDSYNDILAVGHFTLTWKYSDSR